MFNEDLDDEWVLNSHADTDQYSIGSSTVASEPNYSDPLQWILNSVSKQTSCPQCHVSLSMSFLMNPVECGLNDAPCTCLQRRSKPAKPSKPTATGDNASIPSTKEIPETGPKLSSRKKVDPLAYPSNAIASIKLTDSILSPYLVHMEKEYFGDPAPNSKKLHIGIGNDFGKRFGNTVSQDQLDRAGEKVNSIVLSATLPSRLQSQKPLKFNILGDNEDGDMSQSFDSSTVKAPKLFHQLKNRELSGHGPYDYRQEGIIGISGGNYPFDRRPVSASAEAAIASLDPIAKHHVNSTSIYSKRQPKKPSVFHSAVGAKFLAKLHPSLKLHKPKKESKGSGSARNSSGNDFFNMTSTGAEAELYDEEYNEDNDDQFGSFVSQESAIVVNIKPPKAAHGTVRSDWELGSTDRRIKTFEDMRKFKDEEHIRLILQKKIEAGERIPLPSQSPSLLAATAVSPTLVRKQIALHSSYDSQDNPNNVNVFNRPSSTDTLSGSIFDPHSEARKTLQKARSEILTRQFTRAKQLAEKVEQFFLDDDMNLHGEDLVSESVDDTGCNDPLYIISREEDTLADASWSEEPFGKYLPIIRGSELKSLASFSAISPEMWVTARVAYFLLILYHDVMVNHAPVSAPAPTEDILDTLSNSKSRRPSILKDIRSAIATSVSSKGPSVSSLPSVSEESCLSVNVGNQKTTSQGTGRSVNDNQQASGRSARQPNIDLDATSPAKGARGKEKSEIEKEKEKRMPTRDKLREQSKKPPAAALNDAEYISALVMKTKLSDLWEVLREQRTGEGINSLAQALQKFSWPLLQRLLDMHTHVALAMHIMEHGDQEICKIDDDGEPVLNSPSRPEVNKFYSNIPRSALPLLRTVAQRKVFRPECVAHTSAACAKLCKWARRIIAGIHRAKCKESTIHIPSKAGEVSLSTGQLPPLQRQILSINRHASQAQQFSESIGSLGSSNSGQTVNVLELVNYTAAGRPTTVDGKTTSLSVVAVGFDIYAHASKSSTNDKLVHTFPLVDQFVLDDVLVVGMILSRPFDRLDILIPSPPETMIQQHLIIQHQHQQQQLHQQNKSPSSALFKLQAQHPNLTELQLSQLEAQQAKDDFNWARYEALSHFCKAHIEAESNSPSHRIIPAAVAFDEQIAMDVLVEDGLDHNSYNSASHRHGISVSLSTLHTTPRLMHEVRVKSPKHTQRSSANPSIGGSTEAVPTTGNKSALAVIAPQKVSRADIINKFNTFNRLNEHRQYLQKYGERQVFNSIDVLKYAGRSDVQADLVVVGFPSGRGAQDTAATWNLNSARQDVNAEFLTTILRERKKPLSMVIASAGISRTPVRQIPDQPHLNSAHSISEILRKRGPSRFVVAVNDSPSSFAAVKLAMSLCKPCDLIFLIHIVISFGHLGGGNRGLSQRSIQGFNTDADKKAAILVDRYKRMGYNLHIEKFVLSGSFELDLMNSIDMTAGIPKRKEFFEERLRAKRRNTAEAILKCAMTFDPTFLVLGASTADLAYAFEVLKDRSLAEIEAIKSKEMRKYRLRGAAGQGGIDSGSSVVGGLVTGGQLDNVDDDDVETDAAFENEISALASVCDLSAMSNSTAQYITINRDEPSALDITNAAKAEHLLTEKFHDRSLVEAVIGMGSDPSRRGGKRGVGRCAEKFSFILSSPAPNPTTTGK